jgi:UDP-glucose 4-epimerase
MAKCVVIGGNGFLGSHMVDELVARGHEVAAFDRFSTSVPTYTASGVRPIVGDFLNVADLRDAVSDQDYLFHFLSTTTPASAENDPSLDVRTNVAQSIELFEAAVQAGISKVYFASTGGAIYGDQNTNPISEYSVPAPMSPYAIGKQAIEGYLRYFQLKHGLESVSFRISNPYGPRQHPRMKQGVIPIFLQRIARGLPITLYGDGMMVRDFVYVEDVARMIAETVDRVPRHSFYNIGSGLGTTVNDVLALAREVSGRDIAVRYEPRPVTFVDRSVLDVGRFTSEFGLGAFVPLREGLERTWRDILEQMT